MKFKGSPKRSVKCFEWLLSIRLSPVKNGHMFDDDANRIIDFFESQFSDYDDLKIAMKEAQGQAEENFHLRRELKEAHEVVQIRDKRVDRLEHMLRVCVAMLDGTNTEDGLSDVIRHAKEALENK